MPPGTLTRELAKLAGAGLLKREKRGNQQVCGANTASPVFAELASILRKTSDLADVLTQALAPVAERPWVRAGRQDTVNELVRTCKAG